MFSHRGVAPLVPVVISHCSLHGVVSGPTSAAKVADVEEVDQELERLAGHRFIQHAGRDAEARLVYPHAAISKPLVWGMGVRVIAGRPMPVRQPGDRPSFFR